MSAHAEKTLQPHPTEHTTSQPETVMTDNRPEAAAQMRLQSLVNNSLRVQSAAQLRSRVAQRTTLNGALVQEDNPYANGNEDAIITHMEGEWPDGRTVTGGHLLSAMTAAWGAAAVDADPDGDTEGVFFEGGLPTEKFTPHQRAFRIVSGGEISNRKQSTFWPSNWTSGQLRSTLRNSWRCGPTGTHYASKQNATYWYRWQTLGVNSAFPIEKVATAAGTERSRMKGGRA